MTRIAVVGMGLMGMRHAKVFQTMSDVEVTAAIDIDPARREEARRLLAVPTSASLVGILDEVDAVSVALPDHLHVDVCVQSLECGKYVLVEKPLATTSSQGREILNAQPAPGRLMVGHLLRFDLRLQELRRRIAGEEFGPLRYVRIHRANTTANAERFAGKVAVTSFLGIHDLDLLLWLTGLNIEHVSAAGKKFFGDRWDLSVAYLELTGGVQAVVENHWLIHPYSARSCLASVQVFGERGTAIVDLSTDELEITTDELGRSSRVDSRNWTHDPDLSGGSLRRELESFLHCVRDGGAMPVPGEDALRAVDALEMLEATLETHGRL